MFGIRPKNANINWELYVSTSFAFLLVASRRDLRLPCRTELITRFRVHFILFYFYFIFILYHFEFLILTIGPY